MNLIQITKTFLLVVATLSTLLGYQPKVTAASTLETMQVATAVAQLPFACLASLHPNPQAKSALVCRILRDCIRLTNQSIAIYNHNDTPVAYLPIAYDVLNLFTNIKKFLKKVPDETIISDLQTESSFNDDEVISSVRNRIRISDKFAQIVYSILLTMIQSLETYAAYCLATLPGDDSPSAKQKRHSWYFTHAAMRTMSELLEAALIDQDDNKMKAMAFCLKLLNDSASAHSPSSKEESERPTQSEENQQYNTNNEQDRQREDASQRPQQSANDPYDRLGVSRDADEKTISKAFRELSRKHHPDKGGDAEVYKEIVAARDYLLGQK